MSTNERILARLKSPSKQRIQYVQSSTDPLSYPGRDQAGLLLNILVKIHFLWIDFIDYQAIIDKYLLITAYKVIFRGNHDPQIPVQELFFVR